MRTLLSKLYIQLGSSLIGLIFLFSTPLSAGSGLDFKISAGWMIHDVTYLPRPDYWPPDWEWDGTGLNSGTSYRYGPALIRYGNDNLHFWSCSEGDDDLGYFVADYIRYKHSYDGGKNWGTETIALAPTQNSADGWAICDPNVVKIGNYFFMAYTATRDSTGGGLDNEIFLARSASPNRDFKKWNGSGWGGNPAPVIRYTGSPSHWGLGEPNMVVKGNTLYLYYTEKNGGTDKTVVATASVSNANWPANLVQRGYAISSRAYGEDQTDVKYLPEVNRFIATAVGSRFTSNSYIHVWQSTDGLSFSHLANISANTRPTAHNLGMSGDYLGHAAMGKKEFIAYGYSGPVGEWGRWNTWLNPVNITGLGWVETPDTPDMTSIYMLLLD